MGGVEYTQSTALLRYAGKLGGLCPDDPIEALKVSLNRGRPSLDPVFAPNVENEVCWAGATVGGISRDRRVRG